MRESHHTTNQPTKVPTRRLALSLVEILLTVGIVGSLIMAMMSFFATTRGRYTRSEAYLNSAVLAQMVVERFRNEVSLNPELLATLSSGSGVWEFTGGAVDPGQASAPGRPLVDTFRWLFARGNEPLFGAVENEVSIRASAEVDSPLGAAMQSLLDNFRDYTIMIRIEDDKDLEPDPSGTPGPLKEMVKRVTVSTERASIVARDGEDPQAFILTTRVLTPVESLSGVAVEALRSNFDNYTLDQAWEEFFQVLSPSNPYFQMLSDSNRKLLADCYLILGYINGEAFLMDGTQLADGLVVTKAPATRTLNAWIDLLDDKNESNAYYRYPVFKRELVKLHTLKMKVIFDTFKALLPVLEHMAEAHEQLKPTFNELKLIMDSGLSLVAELNATTMEYMGSYREGERDAADAMSDIAEAEEAIEDANDNRDLRAAERNLATAQAALAAAQAQMDAAMGGMNSNLGAFAATMENAGVSLMAVLEFVTLIKFIRDAFTGAQNALIVDRLGQYGKWWKDEVAALKTTLEDHLAQTDQITPLEQVISSLRLAEASRVSQLTYNAPDPDSLAKLRTLGSRFQDTMPTLEAYLRESSVHDFDKLKVRNGRFASKVAKLILIDDPNSAANLYDRVISLYKAGGEFDAFLNSFTKFAEEIRLETDSVIARMQRDIMGQRNALTYVTNATESEILSAMGGMGF